MQVHGMFNGSVGHRLIVWEFQADPDAQRGGKHAQALGRPLHEGENTSLKRICAGSNVPCLGLVGPYSAPHFSD